MTVTMNLTKITTVAGVAYLLKSVVKGDGTGPATSGAIGYYTHPGTPAGVWVGSAVPDLGLAIGDGATREQAERQFSRFAHPVAGTPLGAPPRQLHTARAQESPDQVSGFDLTFSIPKSVSVIWGVADRDTQAAIMTAHRDAITRTLDWFETEVASTRQGRAGVASASMRGVIAIAYDHFETRDGDPHLHTHVALANRVRRTFDGKWLTLDGRTVYRSAVAMSELHQNALLDLLHERLGMVFVERSRPDARSTRSVVADVAGFPPDLVERFSTRRFALRQRRETLERQWLSDHTDLDALPPTVQAALDAQAWRETRKPKDAVAAPLSALTRRWRDQLRHLGHDARGLIARVLDHEPAPAAALQMRGDVVTQLARLAIAHHLTDGAGVDREHLASITDADVETWLDHHDDGKTRDVLARSVHDTLARRRATWSRFNARAEVERLTRLVRFRPYERQGVIDRITDAAIALCVPITPHRYELPAGAAADPRLAYGGHAVFDNPNLRLFTAQEVLDAEAFLDSLTDRDGARVAPEDVETALAAWQGQALAVDQIDAVRHLAGSPHALTALVGPAGSGKTTTMRALHDVWTTAHGPGTVLGVAPSARAANELAASVGIDAHTLAMLLARHSPDARAGRAARRRDYTAALNSTHPRRRAAAARGLAALDAEEASYTLRHGTLVVVDEASMCSTRDLAALGRLAVAAGAKIALVGDPAQLDAIDAGGILGWLDRQGKTAHLSRLFRFDAPWEAAASLRLRDGDATVLYPDDDGPPTYADAGRIHDGDSDAMLDAAYDAVRTAQRVGRTAVLVAATNDHVADLNLRTTLDRREAGEVDTTRLVTLRAGQDAGVGDLLYARLNDYRNLRDDSGVAIHNGDLLRITAIDDHGSATCRRVDTGANITLPRGYLAQHCDLGYALTAHRAQGITVDEAHLFVPYGARMTRELLYVAMTRGRINNTAWVGLPDAADLAHENRSAFETDDDGARHLAMPTGASILARALAAVGAEQTAHEQRDTDVAAHTNLGRLVAEHETLASHAVAPRLAAHLAWLHPEIDFTASPAWDALVSTFRHAYAVNPDRALRLLRISPGPCARTTSRGVLDLRDTDSEDTPVQTGGDPASEPGRVDPTAITQWRLAGALVDPAPVAADDPAYIAGLVVRIQTDDAPLADLARQCEALITARVADLARQLDDDPPPWLSDAPPAPDPDAAPELRDKWRQAILAVTIYRDTWQVTAPTPLGPVPVGDRRRLRHFEQTHDLLAHWHDGNPKPGPDLSRPVATDPHADIDWEALDPGDHDLDVPPGAQFIDNACEPLSDPAPYAHDDSSPTSRTESSWCDHTPEPYTPDPGTLDRIAAVNTAAWDYWQSCAAAPSSWVRAYLTDRGLRDVVPHAHAPAGWTTTIEHLRRSGFTDDELLDAGLATRTRTGRLIDRFRDRLPLPIYDDTGSIAGFTARANPAETTARPDTPKYLNTPTTAAYDKSRLLYGLTPEARQRLAGGAAPVLVEGPMDAAAIDTLTRNDLVPIAVCGTAVTPTHLSAIARDAGSLNGLVVAFDADAAGQAAAARLWSLLGPGDAGPTRQATWSGAKDPGELIQSGKTKSLDQSLAHPRLLAVALVERLAATAIAPETIEGQVLLLRAVAAEVAPTRNTEAITAATNALVDSFGPDSAIDHTIVTEEFADARPKVGHTEEFGGGEPYPGEDLTDQTATMT
ncbi:DNA primase catalytic core [Isoptericola jiangsuensis]|uniref:DNA primase catalytic core n=1 Tax=Isoptericola jiangsuensis TaxID=548579 RepID=A0A2A9F020_9MICO|nr:MobF family relaxase [Isoptericola jiangsuensis]PFG43759.1 DNA primase catalytic core [Isoptericola jiangsuensis]